MDFETQQNAIKTYIQSHLPTVLTAKNMSNLDAYVDDFLDLDKYTKSKQLFYDFNEYNFDVLTGQSRQEEFRFSIYLVFRKSAKADLKSQMLQYASALYEMFETSGSNFGGIADYGEISTVQFYLAAEGNLDVKIAQVDFTLYTEE